jgi:hypothetical protein
MTGAAKATGRAERLPVRLAGQVGMPIPLRMVAGPPPSVDQNS